ncbi:hypothetical protein, partial [Burkholderia cenocepacia]|uniref:hypothetical protein n=1 Tax=Burkholderia cenocepacia TaxID=95486 RepID=UPI00351C8AB4
MDHEARLVLGRIDFPQFLDADPVRLRIGIKELWEIDPAKHKPGLVIHTAGWPLKS